MTRAILVIVWSLLAMPAAAFAGGSHIHFSFGAPYCWGPYCDPWPRPIVYHYAPRPVYVVPAPVVPTYVAPTYAPAPAAASANWSTRTQPRANLLPAVHTQTATVTIRNPATHTGSVAFVVDDSTEVSLEPGQTQTLASRSQYVIEFDRGGDFGAARKTLSGGAYEFVVTDRGWDLIESPRIATKPTIRRNPLP